MHTITAGRDEAGSRLDKYVRRRCNLLSLSTVYKHIRTGRVRINGTKKKPSYKIQPGDEIRIDAQEAALDKHPTGDTSFLTSLVHTDFYARHFSLQYEDEYFLACNKPSGIVVHPGSGHTRGDTMTDLVRAYLHTSQDRDRESVSPVHRLDKHTSGVLLFAKNKQSARTIHARFRDRQIHKHYTALCRGRPPAMQGHITADLHRRYTRKRGTMVVTDTGTGKSASTRYRVQAQYGPFSLLECTIDTGRTHQIRVHCASAGFPVVNDDRYGSPAPLPAAFKKELPPQLLLHAHRLSFVHPVTGDTVSIDAPLPSYFSGFLSILKHNDQHAAHKDKSPHVP
jgi:RluA family pseudouridine synthase